MHDTIASDSFVLPADVERRTVEEERLHRKRRLAASYRIFALKDYDHSLAGHITVRDPGDPECFWVAPLGPWFGHVRVSDLVLVDHDGKILEGRGPINQAGFAIHSEIHKARPDVIAAAHSHSIYGKAWSSLGRLLDPITQDSCVFYGNHALYADFGGVVLDSSEGQRIARTLGDMRAIILQNHGILTVGPSVESAVSSYVAFEVCCETQLRAETAGIPKFLSHVIAQHTSDQVRLAGTGTLEFRALWDRIVRQQPDFLE